MGSTVFPAAGGGVTQKVSQFTSTGTFVVPSNCSAVQVLLVGAGGGGGCGKSTSTNNILCAGGGGGGEVYEGIISVTAGASYTVTIGAGGAGSGAVSSAGGTGGSTTFGSLATANGGGGGAGIPQDYSGFTGPTRNGGYGGGGNQYAGGGGGGAGGNATGIPGQETGTSQGVWAVPLAVNNTTRIGGMGFYGTTNTAANGSNIAGIGKYGFGNGGPGACRTWDNFGGNTGAQAMGCGTSRADIFMSNTSTLTAGTSATANTGDGGGGAASNWGAANTRTGWNGGSGFARVIYWS